ncbi:MAG: excinuclease ABC subunit UvrA, partial [Planctomycetes bacterium]|nr:excinuclease ABC subunit UvrA [Planctomycetota bacterium]
ILPRNQLIVFTGVSGSGKSSLAFDTLYAEGQRRYVESLSSYARQFLGQLQKPDVDFLSGLSPTISIQQKSAGRNPRSTVGTITEIHDYLRVLFARIGLGHCPDCGNPITAQSREQILAQILVLPKGTKFLVLAPLIRGQKGEYKDLFEDLQRKGFVRARADKKVFRLGEDIKLDRKIKHDIEVVIDRLKIDDDLRSRLAEAVEQALQQSKGSLIIAIEKEDGSHDDILLSSHYACLHCNKSVEPPSPQLFSFNSPHGMCMQCDGLGISYNFDPDLMVPDPSLSFSQGAIAILGKIQAMGRWRRHIYAGVANTLGIDPKAAWKDLPKQHQDWLLFGSGDTHIVYEWKMRGGGVWKHGGTWEGIVPQLQASFKKTAAGPRKYQLEKYMRVMKCSACKGQRLNPQARFVKIAGKSLVDLCSLPVSELAEWLDPISGDLAKIISPIQSLIADEILKELRGRVGFLLNLGLHYLSLERSAPTLSGGEAQRIRLAGQIGCGLVGVLYILDEPSIGLHPRDNERLIESLKRLRDFGNTVIVVEHDEDTMRAADFIVDFGPGPGIRGGEIVATGSYDEIVANKNSLTGKYLSGKITIDGPPTRRKGNSHSITVIGARHHNLKNINAEFPLGKFICVTGASGSGKSSLVNDILKRGLSSLLNKTTIADPDVEAQEDSEEVLHSSKMPPGEHDSIKGFQHIDKVINIDQTAIGRTPRSNPATYIKVFDEIRALFAELPEAKIRGYQKGRFSFNRPGGRCEACEGNGSNRLEMDFLADVWVPCPVCESRRFNRETLQVRFKEKNIQEVLEMDIQQAVEHFQNIPKIHSMLKTLHDVGLDYMKLGQPAPTLSGGEAQRIKLAKELCKRSTGKTLYLLDEPTTGLHFEDIRKLLQVLHGFVDAGNTVLVIEHNLDVIKTADWIIDLGPEGGKGGGEILFAGTPDDLQKCKISHTGSALKEHLNPKIKGPKPGKSSQKKKGAQQPLKYIEVAGAQQHNLKNVNVSIPRDKMTVCSGPSGSGKSSLAMDTIYAEGQRRYIESLSAYARQFLGQMQKPRVEHVTGLSPAIAIEQKNNSKSPRSTIGTITEIHDYLRILFCRLGEPHCPKCNIPVGTQTSDEIIAKIESMQEGSKIYLMAPIERKGQDSFEEIFNEIRSAGYLRVRIDGKLYTLENIPEIDHRRKHNVEVVVDRLVIRSG